LNLLHSGLSTWCPMMTFLRLAGLKDTASCVATPAPEARTASR
jgi:hypothetical protein